MSQRPSEENGFRRREWLVVAKAVSPSVREPGTDCSPVLATWRSLVTLPRAILVKQ